MNNKIIWIFNKLIWLLSFPCKIIFCLLAQILVGIFLIITSPIDCILSVFLEEKILKLKLKNFKKRIEITEKRLAKIEIGRNLDRFVKEFNISRKKGQKAEWKSPIYTEEKKEEYDATCRICGKKLWLRNVDAGTDKEVFPLSCKECLLKFENNFFDNKDDEKE